MMKKIWFIEIVICLLLGWSCSNEMVGPSIEGITIDTFNIKTAESILNLDFANGEKVQFVGEWEQSAKWIITIEGETSGATKTIKGTSQKLDTTIVWDGSADVTFFKQGETCKAVLSFENYNDTQVAEKRMLVTSEKTIEGIVLADFDGIGGMGWGDGGVVENGVELPAMQMLTSNSEGIIAPQGNTYLQMSGYEPGGKYYIAGNLFSIATSPLEIDVQNIGNNYLNFFIYGYPDYYANTTLYVRFADSTGNELGFQDRISINKEGWTGISIPLSKFKTTANETGIPFNYSQIIDGGFALFSVDGTECSVKCAVDYFILTKGKPLFNIYN